MNDKWGGIMPPKPKNTLTADQRTTIFLWIAQGANNTICDSTTASSCDSTNVTYSTTIVPVLSANCISCHNSSLSSGNVDLSTYAGVQTVASNGLFVDVITHSNNKPQMPPGGPLSQCQQAQIKKWVNDGALNN